MADGATADAGTFDSWRLILHGRPLSFADAGAGNTFWRGIEAIYQAGITTGCSPAHYCPSNPVTRAQMAVFLERSKRGGQYTPPACQGNQFSDLSAQTFACAWIERLAADGITTGCGGGNYCPGQTVNRGQMAAFLARALGL